MSLVGTASLSEPATSSPSLSRVTAATKASKRTSISATLPVEPRVLDRGALDRDQPVVEHVAGGLALGDRRLEGGADLVAGEEGQLLAVALPEGLEHHPVGGLRALEEAGDVEAGIGGDDRADAGGGALLVGEAARLGAGRRRRRARAAAVSASGAGLGPGHRLLLVAGALAEHGIEPQAHEQGDHGQQDDLDGQPNSPGDVTSYIGANALRFQIRISPQRTRGPRMLRARRRACYPPRTHRRRRGAASFPSAISKDSNEHGRRRRPPTTTSEQATGRAPTTCPQVGVIAQYVKDLSFENPNAPAVYQWQGQPQMDVQFNIGTQRVGQDVHEVVAEDRDRAPRPTEGAAFQIELLYAGLFALRNVPAEQLQPFLLAEAPRLLFPFARQIIADASIDGGFPPLLLDPIDFAGLYMQSAAQQQASRDGRPGRGRDGPGLMPAGTGARAMNLVKAIGTIGGLTMVSRVLGFARDMIGSRVLGASHANDAFNVAFTAAQHLPPAVRRGRLRLGLRAPVQPAPRLRRA